MPFLSLQTRTVLLTLFWSLVLCAQPAIQSAGIVNAASYSGPVAPGSIVSVFGTFPLSSPSSATALPLPTVLSKLSVQFNGGTLAPLFFASAAQVNMQVPWEMTGQTEASVTGVYANQTGAAQSLPLAKFATGIFSMNQQGTGQGAIQDSKYRLVDAANPALAGADIVTIYCTGLGPVTNQPASGSASPVNPLAFTIIKPDVTIGGIPAHVVFSGLTPGLVGLYQINVLVPASAPIGSAVPVAISVNGAPSNVVTMAVRAPNSDQRADALLTQMTQAEKLRLVHGTVETWTAVVPRGAGGYIPGVPRLGIPDLYFGDGSVGVGNLIGPATALPSSIASAASWDLNEAYKYGKVIGAELRNYGINVNLGGNVNLIGREPRDGRVFETKGEDAILAGKITAAHIRGVQDQHVIGGIKHFAFNDQETGRLTSDMQIDERSARETDLLAFEIGIKDSNVQSVMCSYNLINHVYSCENSHLLTDILKHDWAFQGFVMSDWGATHSIASAANAGLDQEQGGSVFFGKLGPVVQNGQVPQSRLDDMVHRILRAMFEAGLFDYPMTIGPIDTATDQAVAQEAEEQGAVLLKNAGAQLPLQAAKIKSIAVIGSHADIGVLSGGGSAQVFPTGGAALQEVNPCPPCYSTIYWDPSSPLKAIRAMAPNASAQYDSGTDAAKAASMAAASDVAIVFVSQWTSEGFDRTDLSFGSQDALVASVAAANRHTVVVMENGGAQVMPWLDSVSAVLESWYPGQRGGEAIANLLFGVVNPSGRLPITFPASVADLPRPSINAPTDATTPFPVNYSEGLNVGYKWYAAKNITPLFPFGFGLSYTTFGYSNVSVADNLSSNSASIRVSFDLANTGEFGGAEVPQVYLKLPDSTGEPRRLVGWSKVFLQPGERQRVTIDIARDDSSHPLSAWDVSSNSWRVFPGDYVVYIGASATRLVTAGTVHVK